MRNKRIAIHRTLESHQNKIKDQRARLGQTAHPGWESNATTDFAIGVAGRGDEVQAASCDGELRTDDLEINEEIEQANKTADTIDQEKEKHAHQLRHALDLISAMTAEDFFDPRETGPHAPDDYNRMDWLYEEMDADYQEQAGGTDRADEDPNEKEDVDEVNWDSLWFPFKNKMVSYFRQ
ncbi:hypothetical protein PGT21_010059 [Puccinia graminis f. sp. tritici]|uniref:Uncharacterized protein n=1 Tax=Puccinia graminis f. sp. tritici TaxID=56615 RepID=A0A5B0PKT7_PUCGR|nr:hypothetical protein PGT21_010059 [Puccinia graminis f. sp. tritici]